MSKYAGLKSFFSQKLGWSLGQSCNPSFSLNSDKSIAKQTSCQGRSVINCNVILASYDPSHSKSRGGDLVSTLPGCVCRKRKDMGPFSAPSE